MGHKLDLVTVIEEKIVVDERLAVDDTEEVHEPLRLGADERRNVGTGGVWIEDGEIDVGIGVCGVEEAAECDMIRRGPEFEDTVNLDEVR